MDNPIVACVLASTLAIIAARFAIVRMYRSIDEQGKGPQKDFSTARPVSWSQWWVVSCVDENAATSGEFSWDKFPIP